MTCIVSGCHRAEFARSMCCGHYKRARAYGDPNGGQRSVRGDAMHFVATVALKYAGDNCLIWPYRRDRHGYARMGNNIIVSRYVCEQFRGPPPLPNFEAAHSCGNGNLGCVNPHHLTWKTHAANQKDRLAHGTDNRGERHPLSKLTETDVLHIFSLKGCVTQQRIADLYAVSRGQIHRIHADALDFEVFRCIGRLLQFADDHKSKEVREYGMVLGGVRRHIRKHMHPSDQKEPTQ